MKQIILGIQAVILATLLTANEGKTQVVKDTIIFEAENCFNLSLVQKNIYNTRKSGKSREQFLKDVEKQDLPLQEKNFLLDEINFIYDLDISIKYYEYTRLQCLKYNKIIRKKA